MRTTILSKLIVFLCLSTILSACNRDEDSYGPRISENRIPGNFKGIILKGSTDLILRYDTAFSVRVEANEDIMPHLKTSVSGNNLVIDIDKNFKGNFYSRAYISMPALNRLEVKGSGNATVLDAFSSTEMNIFIDGSGDISLPLTATFLHSSINGSGDISLNGSADIHNLSINGSGNISAFGLTTDTTTAKIDGSGNASVFVNKLLEANINGSGNINYKGYPQINYQVKGSGKVKNAN